MLMHIIKCTLNGTTPMVTCPLWSQNITESLSLSTSHAGRLSLPESHNTRQIPSYSLNGEI